MKKLICIFVSMVIILSCITVYVSAEKADLSLSDYLNDMVSDEKDGINNKDEIDSVYEDESKSINEYYNPYYRDPAENNITVIVIAVVSGVILTAAIVVIIAVKRSGVNNKHIYSDKGNLYPNQNSNNEIHNVAPSVESHDNKRELFCPDCGKALSEHANFCPKCGKKIR